MAGIVVALGASSYPGCAVYSQSLIGASSAGDTGSATDDDAGPACDSAVPPGPPTTNVDGGPDIAPIVAAFNSIDIGVSGPPDAGIPPFGYNLDNKCTCPGLPSCLQMSDAAPNQDCDDNRGRDNLDIQLFRDLPGPASTGTNQIDEGLTAGQFGLLLVIRNYNGGPDDPRVSVEFYISDGLNRDADGGMPAPKFDGTDRWTIDLGSVANGQVGGAPNFVDEGAYVTGFQVVAHLGQLPIAFGRSTSLGGVTMQLSDAIIVGTLNLSNLGDGGGTYGISLTHGTIAGRWPTSQILRTLASIPEEGGTFLCPSEAPLPYAVIKYVVCTAADISTSLSQDNRVPTLAPCDAISVGMQFTASPAQLGDYVSVPPAPSGCMSDSGVPFSDTCSQ